MKKTLPTWLFLLCMAPHAASANWLEDIFKIGLKIYGIEVDVRNLNQQQLNEMGKITAGLTGTHTYGSQYYDPNQLSWGQGTNDWQAMLAMARAGGGSGQVGNAMSQLTTQFPMTPALGSSNETENQYYLLQAQTTLASRAASQVAFTQMNQETDTVQHLNRMIDATPDSKSTADLNNRLAAENAMVNIQQTKLLAVLVGQAAIDSQEKANRAKETAEFFNIK